MAISSLKIVTYGHPILRAKAERITKIDSAIRKLSDKMIVTMHKADGIGLAAPQIGKSIRLFVVDISPIQAGAEPMVFLNVEILSGEGEVPYNEGCLSIPGVTAEVLRPEKVHIRFTDLDGRENEGVAEGILARVIQHETDHLDGKLFIDYLSDETLRPFQPILDQLAKKNSRSRRGKKS